ncbi:hypothetical protein CYMTET_36773 [Cymbomonas tetramitiformis]|uniref:Uncharacterized protein n=1 Tax=Cymbomonas tetramitiformis TaxID=36881 RepID=A0AAE0CGJ2_9CHLO|nr:hypothetical protein CYMTET_36773 [Cymbomonas tetramitiformis]
MENDKSKNLPIPKAKASFLSYGERKAISHKQEQMAMLREFNIAAREKLMNKRVQQIVEERTYALRVEREELDLRNTLKRTELLEAKNRITAEEQLKAEDRKEKDRLREENNLRRYQAWTDSVSLQPSRGAFHAGDDVLLQPSKVLRVPLARRAL